MPVAPCISPDSRDLPARVTLVVGTTAGGTGAHVRMLAAGLAARGVAVSVVGPAAADARFGFGSFDGVAFAPVEFGDRPRVSDVAAALRLRRLLRPRSGAGAAGGGAAERFDVVHAHGLRAGALTVLALVGVGALAGVRGRATAMARPPLVVTVHNAPSAGGVSALIYHALELVVARGADLVLCVSSDLEARMRAAGAGQVGRAVVPAPAQATSTDTDADPVSASVPVTASDRPVVLAAGRLASQKGFGVLVEAAAHWRDLDKEPLLVIAGDGPLAGELRARAAALGVDVAFLGHRDDVPALLATASVFVLPSRWEGQPLVLQEALRAGAAIVATRVGGVPGLVGDDAALLVEPEDASGLAAAVRAVLTDPPFAARLRAAAYRRGAALPNVNDALAAALAAYTGVRPPFASLDVWDTGPVALTPTCLCMLTRVTGDGERQVLLGHKKTGLGTGKIVGLGGHIEEHETPAEAAAREAKEESGIQVAADSLREAAHITFLFPTQPDWDMTVAVFTAAEWTGEAAESEEIRPEWFPVAALPFDRMWDDGKFWLPRVLSGERLRATFTYAADRETVADAILTTLPELAQG